MPLPVYDSEMQNLYSALFCSNITVQLGAGQYLKLDRKEMFTSMTIYVVIYVLSVKYFG